MLNLVEYRKKPRMLADFLPWAALVAPGVVLNKDGSFQRTARFRGPDLESATPAELVGTTARLNNALRRLGTGWAIFVEASRIAAQRYPQSRFPDPVSNLVDAERRAQFEEAGAHFESVYYLTFLWLPPSEEASRAERWLYEGRSREGGVDAHELLNGFIDPDRPRAPACRGIRSGGRMALRLRDPDVSSLDDLDQTPSRARARDTHASRCAPGRRAAHVRA